MGCEEQTKSQVVCIQLTEGKTAFYSAFALDVKRQACHRFKEIQFWGLIQRSERSSGKS